LLAYRSRFRITLQDHASEFTLQNSRFRIHASEFTFQHSRFGFHVSHFVSAAAGTHKHTLSMPRAAHGSAFRSQIRYALVKVLPNVPASRKSGPDGGRSLGIGPATQGPCRDPGCRKHNSPTRAASGVDGTKSVRRETVRCPRWGWHKDNRKASWAGYQRDVLRPIHIL
jgi:hypothetical protein